MANKPRNVQKKNPPRNFFTGNIMEPQTKKRHVARGGNYGDKNQKVKSVTHSDWQRGAVEAATARGRAKKDIAAGRTSSHTKSASVPIPRKNPRGR